MTSELYELSFERDDGIVVISLSGEVDMSNAPAVRQRIAEAITPDDVAVVLDLGSLGFIDSAGLHAVFELGSVLEEKRQRLLVVVPAGSQIDRTIQIVGMPRAIAVHGDRSAALDAARATSPESRPVTPGGGS